MTENEMLQRKEGSVLPPRRNSARIEGKIPLSRKLPPSDPEEIFRRAYDLQESGRFRAALQLYSHYLRVHSQSASAFNNRGNCLRSLGEDERAVRDFRRALEIEPNRVSSRLNLSLARLAMGDYEAAWPDYEARLHTIPFRSELLERPDLQWDGKPLPKGQSLFVFGNQGLGDELQCLRFLPEAFRRAHHVILEMQQATRPLLGVVADHVSVIERGEPVAGFHRWCEIFSLPRLLGVTKDSIPPPVSPHFERDASLRDFLREHRGHIQGRRQIGVVWSGNPENAINELRRCPLDEWHPVLGLDEFQFYSLQKGPPTAELEYLGKRGNFYDLGGKLKNFASTATAIEELDLVITTDTSVPHLAGALGLDAWVLLHDPADWRWEREGNKTPWYPSLRLFRQQSAGDWSLVIREVKAALMQHFA